MKQSALHQDIIRYIRDYHARRRIWPQVTEIHQAVAPELHEVTVRRHLAKLEMEGRLARPGKGRKDGVLLLREDPQSDLVRDYALLAVRYDALDQQAVLERRLRLAAEQRRDEALAELSRVREENRRLRNLVKGMRVRKEQRTARLWATVGEG